MPTLIPKPTVIEAAGNKPKRIEEYVGRVNSKTAAVSVAKMKSSSGWVEPGQTPEFDEFTVVLKGTLRVTSKSGTLDVHAGQAVIAANGSNTARPGRTARNTLPFAFQRFRRI